MASESVPISDFVRSKYNSTRIQQIVESWRVEPEAICDILQRYFSDMGIYTVIPTQKQILVDNMVHHLRHSDEVMDLLKRAKRDSFMRQRSRHSD
jgi:hypothetical protein